MENSQRSLLCFFGIYIFSLQWMLTHQQVNVALKGTATQSSLWDNYYYALFAIDGNRQNHWYLNRCSSTRLEINPWWRVDLLGVYEISNVIIITRSDCCPDQINGAEIRIGNSLVNNGNSNPRCVVMSSISVGASVNYTCNMKGRYVNVFIPNINQILTLCEVEVYGVPVISRSSFLRLKFNSSEDLTNPTMMDKVLQKIKSANIQSPVFQLRWTKEPKLET